MMPSSPRAFLTFSCLNLLSVSTRCTVQSDVQARIPETGQSKIARCPPRDSPTSSAHYRLRLPPVKSTASCVLHLTQAGTHRPPSHSSIHTHIHTYTPPGEHCVAFPVRSSRRQNQARSVIHHQVQQLHRHPSSSITCHPHQQLYPLALHSRWHQHRSSRKTGHAFIVELVAPPLCLKPEVHRPASQVGPRSSRTSDDNDILLSHLTTFIACTSACITP